MKTFEIFRSARTPVLLLAICVSGLSGCAIDKMLASAFGDKVQGIYPPKTVTSTSFKKVAVVTGIDKAAVTRKVRLEVLDLNTELQRQIKGRFDRAGLPRRPFHKTLVFDATQAQMKDTERFDSNIQFLLTALDTSESSETREGRKCRDPKKFFCSKEEDTVAYKYSCKIFTFTARGLASHFKPGENPSMPIASMAELKQEACGGASSSSPSNQDVQANRAFTPKVADALFGELVDKSIGTWLPTRDKVVSEFKSMEKTTAEAKPHIDNAFKAINLGDVVSALDHFKLAESSGLDSDLLFYNLGFAHEAMGDYEDAFVYYDMAEAKNGPLAAEVEKRKFIIQNNLTSGLTRVLEPAS